MALGTREKELIAQGDNLFSQKLTLDSLWQEIADNFYPERADFTTKRYLGEEFVQNLTTSYPILARRDLGNAISTYLRPRSQEWFSMSTPNIEGVDNEGKRWLEWATKRHKRFIYDKQSGFVRATKEGDHDFAAFGQCVISVEPEYENSNILHRCWHLRDLAWTENYSGQVDCLHRKWTPSALDLSRKFKGKVHAKVTEKVEKDPYGTVNVRHIMIPADKYQTSPSGKAWKTPFVSIYIDIDNGHIMEEVGSNLFKYVLPRWQTMAGSQYSFSPAVVAALPDARLLQAISLTLLEAGQKAVNPPMIATQDAIRGDVVLQSGAINWVDYAYDERLGEALRPMEVDKSGLSFGINLRQETKDSIMEAFYLNKLNLPVTNGQMTATEVTQRVQEYIRNALPLFEPMETDYNAALLDMQFETLLRAGAYGSLEDIPKSLSGEEIKFTFDNPLTQAEGKEKGQKFMEAKAMLAESMDLDPTLGNMVDAKIALRDALNGVGVPSKWLRDEKVVEEMDAKAAQEAEAQKMMQDLGQGAQVAEQVGKAGQAVNEAGL